MRYARHFLLREFFSAVASYLFHASARCRQKACFSSFLMLTFCTHWWVIVGNSCSLTYFLSNVLRSQKRCNSSTSAAMQPSQQSKLIASQSPLPASVVGKRKKKAPLNICAWGCEPTSGFTSVTRAYFSSPLPSTTLHANKVWETRAYFKQHSSVTAVAVAASFDAPFVQPAQQPCTYILFCLQPYRDSKICSPAHMQARTHTCDARHELSSPSQSLATRG